MVNFLTKRLTCSQRKGEAQAAEKGVSCSRVFKESSGTFLKEANKK